MTLKRAFEFEMSWTKRLSWRGPGIGREGSLMVSRHACETGAANDGMTAANCWRTAVGSVGARSGWPVCGLSQTPPALALAERNDRSSRKNSSRFLPQRRVRYSPSCELYDTGAKSRKALTPAAYSVSGSAVALENTLSWRSKSLTNSWSSQCE